MNEHDFRREYESLQHQVHASSDLKQRTLAAARASARPAAAQPHRRTDRRGPQAGGGAAVVRRWGLPVAACLVTVALVAGGAPVVMAAFNGTSEPGTTLNEAALASGFSVRAWAADGSSMLELGNDGTIIFDRDTSSGLPAGDEYASEGYFTGCLFRVQGDGIARVQMNVSKGELYRFTSERFTRSEGGDKWNEALNWKPSKRGTGSYFSGYDAVQPISEDDGLPKDSPDKRVGVNLSKKLGSTIDVSAADDPGIATGETSFGLWTNDPYDDAARNSFNAVIDLFEGQTLTVTVTFDDGHTSTQVIELHAASIKVEHENGTSKLVGEIVDEEDALHSLYGTVVEANKDPFPLSLDNANSLAGAVLPATTFERASELQATDQTVADDDLVTEGGSIEIAHLDPSGKTAAPLVIGYPTLAASTLPPNGKTPAEFIGVTQDLRGDLDYMNKLSNEVFGYGFNDDGSLTSDEHRYVTATFDVTNPGDAEATFYPSALMQFDLRDEDGALSVANTSYALDCQVDGADNGGTGSTVALAPGATVQVTILRVLPNRLIDDENLVLAPFAYLDAIPTEPIATQAFAIAGQL